MPRDVRRHPALDRELRRLPRPVQQTFAAVEAALQQVDRPPAYREQIICSHRPRRVLHIAQARHGGVEFRMAYEIQSDRALIWKCGAHEGFYAALKRRAGC